MIAAVQYPAQSTEPAKDGCLAWQTDFGVFGPDETFLWNCSLPEPFSTRSGNMTRRVDR
jgi:hypothetical protein